jgi:DNA-binding transcriptional LysR family regulator
LFAAVRKKATALADHRLLPPLAALRAFEAVGRLGGIRRAAKELMIDHAVVSRHIRSLETWVGVQLVVRHGTGYTLTEKGEVYHQQIYAAVTAIAEATGALMKGGEELKLHIWCIPGFASLWLTDHLGDFLSANRDIDVDFRPADYSPDFRGKDVDGDIRYLREWEEAALPKIVHRFEFVRPAVFPVASPECAAALPTIRSAQDLLDVPLLHEDNDAEWHHWFIGQGVPVPERLPGSRLWHAHMTLNAARQGLGVALANRMLLRDDLEAGRLVAIQPTETPFTPVRFGGYTFIAREDRWNAPAVLRFRRWLQHAVAENEKVKG